MGLPMAQRILGAGLPMWVWARNPAQTLGLKRQGAQVATDLIELAQRARIVITMLRDTSDVEQVYSAMQPGMQPDSIFIDMTTAAPSIAQRNAATTKERSSAFIDAPVTGSIRAAQDGDLTCFIGGDADTIEAAKPTLSHLAAHIVRCGDHGAGYRMKLVNQTILAGIFMGLADGFALARRDAFAPDVVIEALSSGPASGSLFQTYAKRMLVGSQDRSFTIGLLRKDLRLARAEAVQSGISTALLDLALERLAMAAERFGPQAGVHMLSRLDT